VRGLLESISNLIVIYPLFGSGRKRHGTSDKPIRQHTTRGSFNIPTQRLDGLGMARRSPNPLCDLPIRKRVLLRRSAFLFRRILARGASRRPLRARVPSDISLPREILSNAREIDGPPISKWDFRSCRQAAELFRVFVRMKLHRPRCCLTYSFPLYLFKLITLDLILRLCRYTHIHTYIYIYTCYALCLYTCDAAYGNYVCSIKIASGHYLLYLSSLSVNAA
jgi:hypothetical protein